MYGQLKNVSTGLIKQFGLPCTVLQKSKGQYDPATGKHHSSETAVSAFCLFDTLAYDFSSQPQGSAVTVKQGDVLIYVTEKTNVGDVVMANNARWQIINVQPIQPASTALLYQCQGRQ